MEYNIKLPLHFLWLKLAKRAKNDINNDKVIRTKETRDYQYSDGHQEDIAFAWENWQALDHLGPKYLETEDRTCIKLLATGCCQSR